MVKIKEGYIMNARAKAEFDRVNALPRKATGWVSYYFKPRTKYPPRIYVFMHSEIWCDRNRRPMGLHHAFPFLKRPMNKQEIEYHHFDTRLCYHQYEDWAKLIYAEEQEAERLDEEKAGTGTIFLQQLKAFQAKYPLRKPVAISQDKPQKVSADDIERDFITKLIEDGQHYSVEEIGEMLDTEQREKKRLPVIIFLRELYCSLAEGNSKPLKITVEKVQQKAAVSLNRTRRNLVRRIYKTNKLFALSEIREKYPQYTEAMLQTDLKTKRKRHRDQKPKPVVDYRRCQLQKLAKRLRSEELTESEYQKTCCQIVILEQAHTLRLPIPKSVTYNKHTEVYSFHWKTRENVIKSFVQQANVAGMNHEQLAIVHQQMTSSNYSF